MVKGQSPNTQLVNCGKVKQAKMAVVKNGKTAGREYNATWLGTFDHKCVIGSTKGLSIAREMQRVLHEELGYREVAVHDKLVLGRQGGGGELTRQGDAQETPLKRLGVESATETQTRQQSNR